MIKNKKAPCCLGVALAMIVSVLLVTSCQSQEAALPTGKNVQADSAAQEAEWTEKEVNITLEGGSGKATIKSPVHVTKENGQIRAVLVWTSKNYDYIIVDGIKYPNENPGGESTFTIPVKTLDEPLPLIGDTVAMSTPHEIEYTLTWDLSGNAAPEPSETGKEAQKDEFGQGAGFDMTPLAGLEKTGAMEFTHAKGLLIEKYGAYSLIRIAGVGNYLVVPEGESAPAGIPAGMTVLQAPFEKTYEASTSVMDLIDAIGAMDMVRFSGSPADEWNIQAPAERMKSGEMIYAGKYRAPDFERLVAEGCDLAIENTMLSHEPEIKEKLEELDIPVLIETSSYETDPLGRLEWIKLYGLLYGREKEAAQFFDEQIKRIDAISEEKPDGPVVACFYVSDSGEIHVRKPADYISAMIEKTGARTIFTDMENPPTDSGSSLTMQTEDFYAAARDADIILYNSIIGGGITSVDELLHKSELFQDFKAVKEGHVYSMHKDFFQRTTGMADFMEDLHAVFAGDDRSLTYISKLD
ncbi:MAG: ferrichrome ABC transporter substrate-binding protein [Lachnospiraceae bacterium]|nr:ferrichrome ABC transporter substrate-binding protein [Lachnospiraceae bacterium]